MPHSSVDQLADLLKGIGVIVELVGWIGGVFNEKP
jgi:hypothetical protein